MADRKPALKAIEAVADILDEKELTEIEYRDGDFRIRVSRLPAFGPAPAPAAASSPAVVAAGDGAETPEPDRGHEIMSPMVGTFYSAPSPDAPLFVEVGDSVRKGQVVCIIEAMKLMNEIESDCDGVVKECLVENAQGVEFGQPLFRIEARGSSA